MTAKEMLDSSPRSSYGAMRYCSWKTRQEIFVSPEQFNNQIIIKTVKDY
jgi:hypothetical protein